MALWTSQDVEQATNGKSTCEWHANGVSIDSRTLEKGDIFVVIQGENFDGHSFVKQALEKGAAAAIVTHKPDDVDSNAPLLIVENTFQALQDLATASRKRVEGKIIGVTGSVGKTSVKEMLKHALDKQGKTFASTGNLNNHYGVPLSLSRMPADTDYGIFEMGMNHPDEIRPLTKLVKPDAAIISTVEAVHLEFFDSVEQIADAKAEIFEGIIAGGTAVLNKDNPYFLRLESHAKEVGIHNILTFGEDERADFRLISYENPGQIQAQISGKSLEYTLGITGKHQALNSLGVLALIQSVGGDIYQAAKDFSGFESQSGRGKSYAVHKNGIEFTVIDDSYNASPASVAAAIENLNGSGRKLLALGDMFELGAKAPELHRGLAKKIIEKKIDLVFTAGDLMKNLYDDLPEEMRGEHASNSADLSAIISKQIRSGDVLLVKGSRGMRMDKIVDYLKEEVSANAL